MSEPKKKIPLRKRRNESQTEVVLSRNMFDLLMEIAAAGTDDYSLADMERVERHARRFNVTLADEYALKRARDEHERYCRFYNARSLSQLYGARGYAKISQHVVVPIMIKGRSHQSREKVAVQQYYSRKLDYDEIIQQCPEGGWYANTLEVTQNDTMGRIVHELLYHVREHGKIHHVLASDILLGDTLDDDWLEVKTGMNTGIFVKSAQLAEYARVWPKQWEDRRPKEKA